MKLYLLITAVIIAFASSLVAEPAIPEHVAVTVIEDFSDPKDNPQFNADVAAALVALAQSRQLTLNYRVVRSERTRLL